MSLRSKRPILLHSIKKINYVRYITQRKNSQRPLLGRIQQRYTAVVESRFRNSPCPIAGCFGLWYGRDAYHLLRHCRRLAGRWFHLCTDQPEGDFAQGLQRRVLVQPDVQHYYIYITLLCRTADCRLLRYARADTAVPSLLLGIRHFQHEHCTEGISIQEPQDQGHYRHLHFKSDSLRHCGHHTRCQRIRLLGYCTAKHLFHHRNDDS